MSDNDNHTVTISALNEQTRLITEALQKTQNENFDQFQSLLSALSIKLEADLKEVNSKVDAVSSKCSENSIQINKLIAESACRRSQGNGLTSGANYQQQRQRDQTILINGYTPKDADGNIITATMAVAENLYQNLLKPVLLTAIEDGSLAMTKEQLCSPIIIEKAHVLPIKTFAEVVSSTGESLEEDVPKNPSSSPSYILRCTSRNFAELFFFKRQEIYDNVHKVSNQKIRIKKDLTPANRKLMTYLYNSDLVASYPDKNGKQGSKMVKIESGYVRFCKKPFNWLKVVDPYTRNLEHMTETINAPVIDRN